MFYFVSASLLFFSSPISSSQGAVDFSLVPQFRLAFLSFSPAQAMNCLPIMSTHADCQGRLLPKNKIQKSALSTLSCLFYFIWYETFKLFFLYSMFILKQSDENDQNSNKGILLTSFQCIAKASYCILYSSPLCHRAPFMCGTIKNNLISLLFWQKKLRLTIFSR